MRILRLITLVVFALIIALAIATYFVLQLPQFGKAPFGEHLEAIQTSPQHNGAKFENYNGVVMEFSYSKMLEILPQYFDDSVERTPKKTLEVLHPNAEDIGTLEDSVTAITWYGHSAFILEIEGKTLLLDPMFGPAAAPFSFQVKRFTNDLPVAIEDLPNIDAVIFSHDHYDHLDYPTIQKIKDKVGHFFVPLGLGSHLEHWGVERDKITELDWWQQAKLDNLDLVCTPSQHFSGRGISDGGSTLWASWVIKGRHQNIFFSGDSGYFKGFKMIGDKYGPFDFAMIECGQYNLAWHAIHMLPEESAMAAKDLGAKQMMPIHWGMFELALHPWTEPVERVTAKAKELNIPVITPKIGERFELTHHVKTSSWWKHN